MPKRMTRKQVINSLTHPIKQRSTKQRTTKSLYDKNDNNISIPLSNLDLSNIDLSNYKSTLPNSDEVQVFALAFVLNNLIGKLQLPRHIFIDMDGCVAEYRDDNKITLTSEELTKDNLFTNKRPIKTIIKNLYDLHLVKDTLLINDTTHILYILSQVPELKHANEKQKWLHRHMSFIEDDNMHFVSLTNNKIDELLRILTQLNIDPKDAGIIDDNHDVLIDAERNGVKAYHISSFIP